MSVPSTALVSALTGEYQSEVLAFGCLHDDETVCAAWSMLRRVLSRVILECSSRGVLARKLRCYVEMKAQL